MRKGNLQAAKLAGIVAAICLLSGPAAKTGGHESRFPERDQETIRRSFAFTGTGARSLEVDNVTGSIEVVGTDSGQVQLVLTRTTRADSQGDLEKARKEVTLEVTEEANAVKLYVNGPFRCCWECEPRRNCRSENRDYVVKMDFQLQVPRNIDLTLKTVNEGAVRVRDVKGAYKVRNVNGGIEMLRVAGSGSATTVNGPVKVTFRENPREGSSFKSINGDVDLHFQPGLSADFRFKTFNGAIYSDFVVTSLPARSIEKVKDGGKTIFRADRFMGGRVGAGGTEIQVENLNGDIRIRENHE